MRFGNDEFRVKAAYRHAILTLSAMTAAIICGQRKGHPMALKTSNFSFVIRPPELSDARDINILRRTPEIAVNLLALPSEPIAQNEKFISSQLSSMDDHLFCVEVGEQNQKRVVALAGLHVRKLPRQRHTAVIGIMIHSDFQGKGLGSKLMAKLIDLADNWLMLKRIDLTVYPDNLAAIALYEKFGFVTEGTMKAATVRNGKHADVLMMARVV